MFRKYSLYIAWLIALIATAGTLVAQYVFKLEPCVLCWFQRAFIYPLVLVIPIGILSKDKHAWKYVFGLALAGLAFAVYHELLYIGVISEALAPCAIGTPCTQKLPEVFGFINIIVLSIGAFASIATLALINRTTTHE